MPPTMAPVMRSVSRQPTAATSAASSSFMTKVPTPEPATAMPVASARRLVKYAFTTMSDGAKENANPVPATTPNATYRPGRPWATDDAPMPTPISTPPTMVTTRAPYRATPSPITIPSPKQNATAMDRIHAVPLRSPSDKSSSFSSAL